MGRIVAMSRAADPRSTWATGDPAQRIVNSCALAVLAVVVFVYGLSGFVFGYLHFFMLGGFAPLHGFAALAAAAGSSALAMGWASHLVQRHWSTADTARCKRVRYPAYGAWGLFWAAAVLVIAVGQTPRPMALAPDAHWFLAPLPWVWPLFLGFAADSVVLTLLLVGLAGLLVLPLVKRSLVNISVVGLGIATCCFGAYLLGDAAWQYAAGRGLLKNALGAAKLAGDYARNPGSYNAWTFVCWLGGWAALAMGALGITGGLFIRERLLRPGT